MAVWSAKREFILKAVEDMYTEVASRPDAVFHFPTGRLACLFVGYPADQLDCLPPEATESFAGVGYPFAADVIRPGDTVLDIGSGSGTDTLIAALATGPTGVVYGLDMTAAMREKLARNVAAMADRPRARHRRPGRTPSAPRREHRRDHQQRRPEPRAGQAGRLRRDRPRPQARGPAADRGHRAPVPVSDESRVGSAALGRMRGRSLVEDDYLSLLRAAGLDVDVLRAFDYFAGSVSAATRRAAHGLGAHAIVMWGGKATC